MVSHTSKGKVTPMSATQQNAATALSQPVDLSKIYADYDLNSRSKRNIEDMADTESAGFEGFQANIGTNGQITNIILRNTNGKSLSGKKVDQPYEVVVGFRRFRAISNLHAKKAKVPNLPPGTILAEVREVKTIIEFRILNGIENVQRKDLKAPDMVFLARELATVGGMNQVSIADALGITQGWVSKLLKVGGLPLPVLEHWRDNKPIAAIQTKDGVFELKAGESKTELTEPEMRALAELKSTPEEITARYIRLVRPAPAQGDSDAAPTEKDKILENVKETAALMGCMVRAGVLDNGSLDWNRVIGPKKKGYPIDCGKDDNQERLIELGDAAQEAFDKEVTKGARGVERKSDHPSAN
ncbi:Nucleoid occlusion protein [uncultured archaeon]|nr:Nucleoid occlusion protein [uncultured archaeon]